MHGYLLLILAMFLPALSQAGVNWTSYSVNNSGIASNQVDDIYVDESGAKWFVHKSIKKYSKFDGNSWTVYSSEDVPPGPWTEKKAKTGDTVWTAPGQGIVKADGESSITFFDRSSINTIKTDNRGNLLGCRKTYPF